MTDTCQTCLYFKSNECLRYPPQVVAYTETSPVSGNMENIDTYSRSEWPSVLPDNWCGEWRAKP